MVVVARDNARGIQQADSRHTGYETQVVQTRIHECTRTAMGRTRAYIRDLEDWRHVSTCRSLDQGGTYHRRHIYTGHWTQTRHIDNAHTEIVRDAYTQVVD